MVKAYIGLFQTYCWTLVGFLQLFFVLLNSYPENTVFATTLPVNETSRSLAIVLQLTNGTHIYTGYSFEYRNNPNITDIRPRNHLIV